MGLDMYLAKKNYVKNWAHSKDKFSVLVKKNGQPVASIKPERITYIVEEIAYWRKANAIHAWFVANVQDGEDDCKEYWVSHEQLQELVDTCKKVLAASKLIDGKIDAGKSLIDGKWVPQFEDGKIIEDASVASELLPTQTGFFFGATDYDQYYVQDLQDTVGMLSDILKEGDGGEFYYHSSW